MPRRILKFPLHVQIFAALLAALAAGLATGAAPAPVQSSLLAVYRFLGTLFLNALKMITVPLIVTAVISGIANLGSGRDFGRLGIKTLGYYLATTTLAVLLGLVLVNVIQPGVIDGRPARDLIGLSADTESVQAGLADHSLRDVSDIFLRMIPTNVIAAAGQGDLLGLIVFSLLFGFFITRLTPAAAAPLTSIFQSGFEVLMRLTDFILRLAPFGVFGLVARVAATTGLEAWRPLALFFGTVLSGLMLHVFLTLPLLLLLFGRVKPWRHFQAMAPALLTAFSTSSSSATTPVTLECAEKRAGVSNRISSFVIPLGATVNMDGTALYECVAALFIAQAYGLDISFGVQFTVVMLAILTSIGVAGIPSASLVAIVLILQNIGLPAEGIGLILATDRLLDMCRTAVNVFGDTCGAVIIARSEGERNVLGEAG